MKGLEVLVPFKRLVPSSWHRVSIPMKGLEVLVQEAMLGAMMGDIVSIPMKGLEVLVRAGFGRLAPKTFQSL